MNKEECLKRDMRYREYDIYGNRNAKCYLSPSTFKFESSYPWSSYIELEQRSAGNEAKEGKKRIMVRFCQVRDGNKACLHSFISDEEFDRLTKMFEKIDGNLKVADTF